LAVACVQFVISLFVLCYCPEMYAVAAAFAGLSVWLGNGTTRRVALVCLVVSLVMTGVDTAGKMELRRRVMEREQRRAQERPGEPK
jgi:hypothetical protein